MASDPATLRPGRPSIEEGRLFAQHLDMAADGVFRALLGKRYDHIVGEAYLTPGHDLSYETVVFADHSGAIAGMASAYSAEQHRRSSDAPLREAAGMRFARMAALTTLGRGLLAFMDDVPDGDYYLQAVSVDDDQRGNGIGSMLIDDAENRARRARCPRLVLDVAEDNSAARRLYERRGMTIEAKSPRIILTPGSSVYRMVKTL